MKVVGICKDCKYYYDGRCYGYIGRPFVDADFFCDLFVASKEPEEGSLVSVVIPTISGRELLLERALDSVYAQTYRNLEVIVVDEGLPATVQRNIGVSRSHGDFIAFLDDDDTWHPLKIEKQMEMMEKDKECPLVICYSHDLRFGQDRVNKPPEVITHKMILKSFNLSSTSSYLVRRRFLDLVCVDNEYFDSALQSAQEYDLAIRLSCLHDVRCVPEVLMTQYQTEGQISENWDRKINGIRAIAEKHGDEYSFIDKMKTVGVVTLFKIAKIPGVGNNIYRILIPLKGVYER